MKSELKQILDKLAAAVKSIRQKIAVPHDAAGTQEEEAPLTAEKELPIDPGLTSPQEGMEVPWETGELFTEKEQAVKREKRQAVARKIRKGWVPLTVLLVCVLFILLVSMVYLIVRDNRVPFEPELSPEASVIQTVEPEEPLPESVPPEETTQVVEISSPQEVPVEEEPVPEETAVEEELPSLEPEEQEQLNRFLSAFSEQSAFELDGYDGYFRDHEELVHFAYVWCRIHQSDSLFGAQDAGKYYYTTSLETVNEVLERFFHLTLKETELRKEKDPDAADRRTYSFYKKGYFYFPAEEAGGVGRLTIVREKTQLDENLFKLSFDVYAFDPEASEDGSIPDRYYTLFSEEAAEEQALTLQTSGTALFRTAEQDGEMTFFPLEYRVESIPAF